MKTALKNRPVLSIIVALVTGIELLFIIGAQPQEQVAVEGNHPLASIQNWQPAAADLQLHLMAVLGLRHTGQLEKLKERLQEPRSPSYHQWLSSADFARQFGPTAGQLQAVTSWLRGSGFTIESADLGTREVRFSGSVDLVQKALGTAIVSNGSQYANLTDPQIPASLAGSIVAFFGLNNLSPGLLSPSPAPTPTAFDVNSPPAKVPGSTELHFSPQDFWLFYNEAPPTDPGANGGTMAPDCIALLEVATLPMVPSPSSSPTPSVLNIFTTQFNLPTTQIKIIRTDPNNPPSQPTDNEPPLDVDWAHAVAPNTPIRLYVGTIPNSHAPAFDTLSLAVSQNVCGAISSSIDDSGSNCPDLAQIHAYAQTDAQAVMQGQTLFHSSGDYGSFYPCGQPSNQRGETGIQPSIEESSASSDVTVVGGTQFDPVYDLNGNNTSVLAPGFEQVWQTATPLSPVPSPTPTPTKGTSGGGISVVFPAPPWQASIVPYGLTAPLTMRGVPDVSAAASPNQPGYWIATTNDIKSSCKNITTTCFVGDGGTSASSPIWAGISRLIAHSFNTTRLGNINPQLYSLAAHGSPGVVDTSQPGNNCSYDNCSAFPGYQVGPGYDLGTGLGSPNIENLIAAFQPGATASASNIVSSGLTGQTVPGGTLTVDNTSTSTETITTVTIALSNPDVFSNLAMGASINGAAAQTGVAGTLGKTTIFTFNPPLSLPANAVAKFTLKATLSAIAARTGATVTYAGLLTGGRSRNRSPMGLALGLLVIGLLAIPGGRRRSALIIAVLIMLLAFSQFGCGGSSSGMTVLNSSQQRVLSGGVAATNAQGVVGVTGL
ncbi:MAG TPA: protease pro-enzyme activation domain-containing protein, partial [Candidatus Binataceae bacterium]|nr:protease pro-enzyme activation domain-containing protein [Candidatus Binataceae bacterium]